MSGTSALRGGDGLDTDHGGHEEMDDERLQAQKDMQMLDLGTGRREYVTTFDKPLPRELRQSKEQLLRARKVNEEGTEAAKWYQLNKSALNAWNNVGRDLADDHADKEKLDDLMGGQSHRARLNRDIKEQGGQEYGEVSTVEGNDYPRRGRVGGGAIRGTPGRSGRGAPMHIPISRATATVIGSPKRSLVPNGPKANRPLDPAIDPDREYAYKTKRGGKTFTMSYSGGAPVRVVSALGRGKTPNDARATMEGSTVRIGPASSTKAKSETSETSRAARPAPVTVALHDEAFLKVLSSMTSKAAFNEHVQEKSKPPPASKAAALVEQPVKTTKKAGAGTKKPANTLSKTAETPAEAFQKMQERATDNILKGRCESIRLAPTHEFAFPPPVTKSARNKVQGSNVSVHTDGAETAATFESADFATQTSEGPQIEADNDLTSIGEDLTAKVEAQPKSNGLGINILPPPGQLQSKHQDDLIVLDQSGEQTQAAAADASTSDTHEPSRANSVPAPSVPDIMDEDLKVDLPHATLLTPNSSVAPRHMTYRGARYVRMDLVPGYDPEQSLQQAHPNGHMDSFNDMFDRVALTDGLNIGLRTLQESSAASILGEQNLPGRTRRSTGASSIPGLGASRWAIGNTKSVTPETHFFGHSMAKVSTDPKTLSPIWQYDDSSFQNAEMRDAPTTDVLAAPSVKKEKAPASNLTASKYATPGPIISASPVSHVESAKVPDSANASAIDQAGKDFSHSITGLRYCEDTGMAKSKIPSDDQKIYSSFSSKTDDLPADGLSQNTENTTLVAPKPICKMQNLAASKWGNHDTRVITPRPSKRIEIKMPPPNSTEAVGRNIVSASVPEHSGPRKRNPFEPNTQIAVQRGSATEKNQLPTKLVQTESVPEMVKRLGNVQVENHAPRTIDECRFDTVGSDLQASTSMSETTAATSVKPMKPLEQRSANNVMEGKTSGSQSFQIKAKPPAANLMASKSATSIPTSFSSFRRTRVTRTDSSSNESEI